MKLLFDDAMGWRKGGLLFNFPRKVYAARGRVAVRISGVSRWVYARLVMYP